MKIPQGERHPRVYECKRCAYTWQQWSPSQVQKCPKCTDIVYDRDYKYGDTLNPYSKQKLRWAKYPKLHLDEIRRRKTKLVGGKEKQYLTDDRGRIIEELPEIESTTKEEVLDSGKN